MRSHAKVVALALFAIVAGCGHSGSVSNMPNTTAQTALSLRGALSIVHTGNFTEYSLTAGVKPNDLTRGPYDTVYFLGTSGGPAKLYQLNDATGAIHVFAAPSPFEFWTSSIISYKRSVSYIVVDHTVPEDAFDFLHVTPEGNVSVTGAGAYLEFGIVTNFALGSDGRVWYGYCIDPCGGPDDGAIVPAGTRLDNFFVPKNITPGPGGNLYFTAFYFGPPPPPPPLTDARVYVISTSGTIIRTISFPNGSGAAGIVTGSDHNLWVAEPGINKIARMTPTGTITQFSIPTANAGASHITYGSSGVLWFTETNANKIGRITTTGSITEYVIPTLHSGASGVTPCTTNCGAHGGVWFTETTANKIGRFNSPI